MKTLEDFTEKTLSQFDNKPKIGSVVDIGIIEGGVIARRSYTVIAVEGLNVKYKAISGVMYGNPFKYPDVS